MTRLTIICISCIIVSLMFAEQIYAQIDPETILGAWLIDEGSGDFTADASGNGHDGTLVNNPAWIDGVFGKALDFSGSSSYVNCGNDPALNVDVFSVPFWCNIPSTQSWNHMISRGQHVDSGVPGSVNWGVMMYDGQETILFETFNDTGWIGITTSTTTGEWHHIVATFDGDTMQLYHDGELASTTSGAGVLLDESRPFIIGARSDAGSVGGFFSGSIDEVGYFNAVLSPEDIQTIMNNGLAGILPGSTVAVNPRPAHGETDVPRDVVLSWEPVETAQTHDVYLGTVFDDVNDADRDNPLDVFLIQGHNVNTYEPGRLELGQTYYWRVDEVNAPPDNTIFTGDVWSFTVEPLAYTIPAENITATASSSDIDKAPENTINGSGLDGSGLLHNTIGIGNMWLSSPDGNQPSFIEYEFDNVYKLHEMWVWNSNESLEPVIGIGFKDVTIEYSTDGINYATFGTTHEFARASGTDDYAHNTTIDFSGVAAKYIRLTANSNWGGILNQYGLSEVRFFFISVQAREPSPASGARDVALEPTLSWRVGREAAEHNIYFSNDEQAVINGTANMTTVTDNSYGPLDLDLGRTYYWRVDEVNNAKTTSTWQGELWDFTTFEYFVIDDFEDYDDYEPNRIFDTWSDGWNIATNGSTVGYSEPVFTAGEHFMETSIVNSGSQSMPYFYDNTTAGNSEAAMTLSTHRDWTKKGISSLTLWYRGNPLGLVEDPAGTYTINASGVDIWGTADEFRYVYKQLSGDGSIIARVESVEDTDPWAKAGVMIRQTLDPGSKFAAVYITPGNGCRFQARLTTSVDATSDTDVATTEQIAITAPYWVKIERTGNTFNGYYSSDGVNWVAMSWNPQSNSMPNDVYIGLAVTSHNAGVTCTAVLSNVETTGTVSPQTWTQQAIGVEMPSNQAERMYVVLNSSAVVYNDDPDAALLDEWTQWNIDLQKFADQNVDLTDVDTLGIGFGDRDNPQAGGAGLVFFDDIMVGNPIPPVGLVAHFELENNADDSSGNGYHGTIVGAPVFVDGPAGLGMALEFDGTGAQYVDLGTFNPSKVTDKLSISLWARWNGLTSFYQGLIGKRDTWAADDMMWQIEVNQTDGTLGFFSEGSYPPDGDPVLPIGEWAHVATTFDGMTAKFYFNGQLTGEGAFSFGTDPQAAIQFGACEADGGNPFNGALDDIRIYDIVLSDAEVLELAGQ